MLEVLIIYCFYYAFRYWKFKGKDFDALNPKEQTLLADAWNKDRRGKNKYTLNNTLMYKNAITYLYVSICCTIIWLLIVIFIYPTLLSY